MIENLARPEQPRHRAGWSGGDIVRKALHKCQKSGKHLKRAANPDDLRSNVVRRMDETRREGTMTHVTTHGPAISTPFKGEDQSSASISIDNKFIPSAYNLLGRNGAQSSAQPIPLNDRLLHQPGLTYLSSPAASSRLRL